MNLRLGVSALVSLVIATASCGGPLVKASIEDELLCPDFEIGATRTLMRGSLRFPVTLAVRDGKNPITRTTLLGRRTPDEPPGRILIPDDNTEYTIEWAQCENQRAPQLVAQVQAGKEPGPRDREAAEYACGNPVVYKTESLVTKRGDAASRTLHFPAPPKQECWESEVPKAEAPVAPSAAAPAVEEPGAAPTATADAGATDAGATDAGLAADAGATDAGAKGAGAKGAGAKGATPAAAGPSAAAPKADAPRAASSAKPEAGTVKKAE